MESSLTAKVDAGLASLALLRHQCQGNGDVEVFHRANGAEGTADSFRPSRQRTRKRGSFAVAGLSQSLLRGGEPRIIIRSWCATKIVLTFFLFHTRRLKLKRLLYLRLNVERLDRFIEFYDN